MFWLFFVFQQPVNIQVHWVYECDNYPRRVAVLSNNWLDDYTELLVTGWEISSEHGEGVGEVFSPIYDGYVEPRYNGINKLRVCFDMSMDTSIKDFAEVSITDQTSGDQLPPCSIVWESDTCMMITLCPALPDQNTYTITLSDELTSAIGYSLVGDRDICITALVGDANESRQVNNQDMLAVNTNLDQPVNSDTARYDINCSGQINTQDMLMINSNIDNSANVCQ